MHTQPTASPGRGELAYGAVVDYHGSHTDAHGRYIIVDVDEHHGRYAITDQDFPWFLLRKVRAASLTPTGEYETLCLRCEHATDWRRFAVPNACSVDGCCCDVHIGPPSSTRTQ